MWDTAKWQSSDSNVIYVILVSHLKTGMQGRITIIISLNRALYCWLGGKKGIQLVKKWADGRGGHWWSGWSGGSAQSDGRCVCLC